MPVQRSRMCRGARIRWRGRRTPRGRNAGRGGTDGPETRHWGRCSPAAERELPGCLFRISLSLYLSRALPSVLSLSLSLSLYVCHSIFSSLAEIWCSCSAGYDREWAKRGMHYTAEEKRREKERNRTISTQVPPVGTNRPSFTFCLIFS